MVPVFLRKLISSALGRNQEETGRPANYYASPVDYWQARHTEYSRRGSLIGVGCIELDDTENRADYLAKWRQIEKVLIDKAPPARRSLLDAGCGNGWFTAKCAAMGFQVSAVDFSCQGVEAARKKLGEAVTWHVSALDEFAPERRYDVVLSIDVLFHLVDDAKWAKAVTNLGTLTEPDGVLVIQEHLIPEAEVLPSQSPADTHCRWRSLDRYLAVLQPPWKLRTHVRYDLPQQKRLKVSGAFASKDLLVFGRHD
jgi:SAM-dependent methyltransferase